ncbi:MAG: 2-keto-4-pentenoate hydratase [Jeotgalicoccus sp.]
MGDAQKLYYARLKGKNLTPGQDIETDTVEAAYEIQNEILNIQGETQKGYKISMTSAETQGLFDSSEPVYGPFTAAQVISGMSLADYNIPLAELELVFYVNETLSMDDDAESILSKCTVAPALELPDGRYTDWFPNISKYEVVADCAVAGAIVIGEAKSVSYDELDNISGKLLFNGEEIKQGQSSEVMGHPVNAMEWLIEKLDSQGKQLEAGQFVSSGTFILPVKLEPGEYEGVFEGLGSVEIEITK